MKRNETYNGLQPLTTNEMSSTIGGFIPFAFLVAVVVSGINNFGDIREGIADGFKGKPRY